jgi:hypothetical protein
MRDVHEDRRLYVEELEPPPADGDGVEPAPRAPERGVAVIWPPEE